MAGQDFGTRVKPTEIRLRRAEKILEVAFEDGSRFELAAEYLRVHSPSAELKGHGPGERKIIGGRRPVAIIGLEKVGNYAVRLQFDDLHDTGIYSWETLYELGQRHDELWRQYLDDLAERGLSRDP